jgi:hypothetical protein
VTVFRLHNTVQCKYFRPKILRKESGGSELWRIQYSAIIRSSAGKIPLAKYWNVGTGNEEK